MRFLGKILLVLGIIVLLAGLKILFRKLFPYSLIFHYNLFSALQLMILFWALLTGLLENTVWRRLRPATARVRGFCCSLLLLALSETGCWWLLHHPENIPDSLLSTFRTYYDNYQRNILQYDQRLACYDTGLFYRMKPNNKGLFSNIEFSDSLYTDALGFRDSSDAAAHPGIICLGDSYTLGWGVRQEECFPSLLTHILKTPVLNTGMSSYGTAREVAAMQKVDRSGISTVIIQYCYNDADENEACVNNHFQPVISPRSAYDSTVAMYRWAKVWFPGKYTCTLLKLFLDQKLAFLHNGVQYPPLLLDSASYEKEADRFNSILARSGVDFDKVRVYVFDIGEYWMLTGKFTDALERKLSAPEYSSVFKGHVRAQHLGNLLNPADYYRLDGHLRPSGQLKIARYLASVILNDNAGRIGPVRSISSDTSFRIRY